MRNGSRGGRNDYTDDLHQRRQQGRGATISAHPTSEYIGMSDAGEKALIEVNAHERECALRYERIEERLAEGSAKFKHLEHIIYGLYALIAAAALTQFFMG